MEFIDPALQAYSEKYSSPEPQVLADLNRETYLIVANPRMLSGHMQGRILAMIAKMVQPKRVLEVGTYTGYSAMCFAEGLAPGGKVTTIEYDPERESIIRRFLQKAEMADAVDLRIGDASAVIPQLHGPFDLAFLDADKENYIRYFEMILPKMRTGGIIIADNMLWAGRVIDQNENDTATLALRKFVEVVAATANVEQVLMPVRDGIMLIRKTGEL